MSSIVLMLYRANNELTEKTHLNFLTQNWTTNPMVPFVNRYLSTCDVISIYFFNFKFNNSAITDEKATVQCHSDLCRPIQALYFDEHSLQNGKSQGNWNFQQFYRHTLDALRQS